MNKILLLEDDISLLDGLNYSLKRNGFEVDFITEGEFPKNASKAALTENAKIRLGLEIGSQITADTPDGT